MMFLAPSCKLIDTSGGSMVFTIPLIAIEEIQILFKLIESDQAGEYLQELEEISESVNPNLLKLKSIVKDCGISHITLEEVFMKVTGKKAAQKLSIAAEEARDNLVHHESRKNS